MTLSVSDALNQRISTRAFLNKPVSAAEVRRLLEPFEGFFQPAANPVHHILSGLRAGSSDESLAGEQLGPPLQILVLSHVFGVALSSGKNAIGDLPVFTRQTYVSRLCYIRVEVRPLTSSTSSTSGSSISKPSQVC